MTALRPAPVENCDACGFGWQGFTDEQAIGALRLTGDLYCGVLDGVDLDLANTRPAADSWSILEYVDHVRNALWIWRFVVDAAVGGLDVDLTTGGARSIGPEVRRFDGVATTIAVAAAESEELWATMRSLEPAQWALTSAINLGKVDQHWVVRHVVHEVLHHLHDVGRIRARLGDGVGTQEGAVVQVSVGGGGVPKLPVDEASVTSAGLTGDHQHDRVHHGRPFQAVCLYSQGVIEALENEGHPIYAGAAGENVTVEGIDWASLRPGAVISLGPEVIVEVSSYATPCSKNAGWFVAGDFRRMSQEHHPGWSRLYATVLRPGRLRAGDLVVVEP